LEKEDWEVVNLPAIAPEDEHWTYDTLWGPREHRREAGDPLHPVREPLLVLEALRRTLGECAFSAQYLQSPVPLGGGIVKSDWLRYYELQDKPETFDSIVQSWDTANKESELADYSVCTTWGVKRDQLYLLHVLRKRMEYPDLKRAVTEQARDWRANIVLIEDKASGTQLIQELRQTMSKIKGVKPVGDKVMRMLAQTAAIENGRVLLPKEAYWLQDYLQELVTFPKAKYDDQVDSTAQALKWITIQGIEPAFITFMYMQIAEARGISIDEAREYSKSQVDDPYDD
jgi:predicted phage terminase large subunit-like protein